MTNQVVEFNNHNIELISQNNNLYITCRQIAEVLDMSSKNGATDLYNAHKSEFDDEMSCLIKHGRTRVRIFNREGAWLIGMFARTPKAAEFRKWVLKVLGAVADGQKADKPVVVSEHTRSLPTGKKEIVLSEKSRTEIGGIFKACLPGIIRAEAEKLSQDMIYSEKFKQLVREAIREELQLDPAQWPGQDWQLTAHHAIDEICHQYYKLKNGIKQLTESDYANRS